MTEQAPYHRLLLRQLKRARGGQEDGPLDMDMLLELVTQAYQENDQALARSTRSLNLMSQELSAANRQLQDEADRITERFEYAVAGANDGIFDWDMVSKEAYYSPRWKSMLGYEPEELSGIFCPSFFL